MNREKNNIDDMTQKYKEEMMKLYSRNRRTAPPSSEMPNAASGTETAPSKSARQENLPPAPEMPKPAKNPAPMENMRPTAPVIPKNYNAEKFVQTPSERRKQTDLAHPPMPKIPRQYEDAQPKAMPVVSYRPPNGNAAANTPVQRRSSEASANGNVMPRYTEQPSRYPNPMGNGELWNNNSASDRFTPVETEEHSQGNYDFPMPPAEISEEEAEQQRIDENYPDDSTDFETLYDEENNSNPSANRMPGTGYLKIEVTTGDGAIPVENAVVIVSERINGMDSLINMMVTNQNGETESIPLPAPPQSLSESANPSERPYSEYNVSIYKRGYFSVPQLTVPIFDIVKSIQPVALIPLAEFEMQGAELPTGENLR